MKKACCILLILTLFLPASAFAAEYRDSVYTFEQSVDRVTFRDLTDYADLRTLQEFAMMGFFLGEKGFHPGNLLTNADALRTVFRVSGREQEAYDTAENLPLRDALGVPAETPRTFSDGFFIAAYQNGMLSRLRLQESFLPGSMVFDKNSYAVRQDLLFWLAKAFGIAPSADFAKLMQYEQYELVPSHYRQYLAGLLRSNVEIGYSKKLNPYGIVSYQELLNILTSFKRQILAANQISFHSAVITSMETGKDRSQTITLSNGDILYAEPDRSYLVIGSGCIDNTYALAEKQTVEYYVRDGKLLYLSVPSLKKGIGSLSSEREGTLYYYDDAARSVVLKMEDGSYEKYYLYPYVELLANGNPISEESLLFWTDHPVKLTLKSRKDFSMGWITKVEIH